MSENIPIFAIEKDGTKNTMLIGKNMLSDLAGMLRSEGPTQLHTANRSIEVHAIILSAKGSKVNMLMLPEDGDSDE